MDRGADQETPSQDIATAGEHGNGEASLSCNNCRKRKLRCSREITSCQHCKKTGSRCIYESKRGKPGMKAGAIDNLHRRLDALEKQVDQQSHDRLASHNDSPSSGGLGTTYEILASFAREFQRFNDSQQLQATLHLARPEGENVDLLRRGSGSSSTRNHPKRRRLDSSFLPHISKNPVQDPITDPCDLDLILTAYFAHIHPWIPMVHEGRLRQRLACDLGRAETWIIVQSMALVAAKYVADEQGSDTLAQDDLKAQHSRDAIVAAALKELSVENTQALIMIAFNDIGSGQGSCTWSLIGALSRNVEYLQLAIEDDESGSMTLSKPFISLRPPMSWIEAEERRRVFWTVFNLDRLCSVMMGWNTSLTSDDMHRRLPCDGIKWRKGDEVVTPYFGIWDKAAGRIGNPIAFLPSHYSQASQSHSEDALTPSEPATSPGTAMSQVGLSNVGAFAYCIEATESLSQVTTYFFQQKVNMKDQKDLGRWLTRFKELDLRLVHWKMLLPHKWKVDISQRSSRMDPNLTLAHITHNASMILLHQPIAFPLTEWPLKNRFPSLCSAETCQAAAAEIATITDNYLKNALPSVPVSSQFAFCLYVAARTSLLSWRFNRVDGLSASFWSIIESLDIIARKWGGYHNDRSRASINLAGKYSQKLKKLYKAISSDPAFPISVLGFTREIDHSQSGDLAADEQEAPSERSEVDNSTQFMPRLQRVYSSSKTNDIGQTHYSHEKFHSDSIIATESPQQHRSAPTEVASQGGMASVTPAFGAFPTSQVQQTRPKPSYRQGASNEEDINTISQLLLDPEFIDMDRIISYDDGLFQSNYEGIL